MTKENAKKASELLEQVEALSMYKKILNDSKHGNISHIEFVQHYGSDSNKV